MTELEGLATDAESLAKVQKECLLRDVQDVWDSLLHRGYAEWTPSGGLHLIYRITDHAVPGNSKIALRPATDFELNDEERRIRGAAPERVFWRTLAETRGEGGYVIVAPTNGSCHKTGQAWITVAGQQGHVPAITWAQREAIHAAIKAALDQSPPPVAPTPRREIVIADGGELRPGDDYGRRTSWDEILTPEGWSVSHRVAGETFWVRPGKDRRDGHSASTGYKGDADRLYVWSTSTGLPSEAPLTKFFVYSHYHHNDDMTAAAKALREKGFGSPPRAPLSRLQSFEVDKPAVQAVAPPPHGGLDLTDTGNGHRMIEDWGTLFRYSTIEKVWYKFVDGSWHQDKSLWIEQAAEATATRTRIMAWQNLSVCKTIGDQAMIKEAQKQYNKSNEGLNRGPMLSAIACFASQPGISVQPEWFDAQTSLLNLPNGTLNLETLQLKDHDPDDLLSKQFGGEYDPEATAPNWERFIEEVVPDPEVRSYVQRALGYSLTGRPIERSMFLLHGPSGTGKSVLTSVMTRVFGDYGATAPASTFRLKKNDTNFDLHQLRGKRFVATSEMPEGALLDEELVKRVTGGDTISSRGLYQGYQDWKPQCVVWIATNFLPKVNSDDDALWRRAKTVPFQEVFAGSPGERTEILGLTDLLVHEASGILNWLLEGLRQYQQQGLNEPEAVTKDVDTYRRDSDSAASFIYEAITDGTLSPVADGLIRSAQLAAMYVAYCEEQRLPPLGGRRLANRFKAMGYESVKVGGQQHWKGLIAVPAGIGAGL